MRIAIMRIALPLSQNRELRIASRSLQGAGASHWIEMLLLIGASVLTAMCVTVFEMNLRMPGHSILRTIVPVSLGISLVPRRASGGVISGGAFGFLTLFTACGCERPGMGALTSLILVGPALDIATWNTKPGWRLYVRCALAGLGANAVAFAVRAGGKAAGLDNFGMRPLAAWWSTAAVTHLAFGLLAGLCCAALWFRFQTPDSDS